MNEYLFITQIERDVAKNVRILRVEMNYLPNSNLRDAILTIEQVIWLMDNSKACFAIRSNDVIHDFIRIKKLNETAIGIQLQKDEEDYFNNLPCIVEIDSKELILFDEIEEYLRSNGQCPENLRRHQIRHEKKYLNFRKQVMGYPLSPYEAYTNPAEPHSQDNDDK